MGKKIVITCALTGAQTPKSANPAVPITPEEIAADAVACAKAGASVLHIHIRDKDGNNTMDTDRWVEVVGKVREELDKANVDAVLNLTSSGSKFPEELRLAHLPILKPEMTSYDPGTFNWNYNYIFKNSPQFLEDLGNLCQEYQIKPECELFDAGQLGNIKYYHDKGFLKGPIHYQLVLGVGGAMDGTLENIAYLTEKLIPGSTWSITGIGKDHLPCLLGGLAAGADGIRVGLEDNIYMDKGVLATNVSLVERAVKFSELANREIATAAEAREILGLVKHV